MVEQHAQPARGRAAQRRARSPDHMTPAEAPFCRIIATLNEVGKTTFALPVP